jgi:hypothetical protein
MRARPLLLAPFAALVAALGAAAPADSRKPDDPETARLREKVERLRHERDLASGKGFYLRLDAGHGRLALMLQGVALDDYAAGDLEWGVPEVLFVDRRPGDDWDAAAFSKGRSSRARRDRVEVVAPAPGAGLRGAPSLRPAEERRGLAGPSPHRSCSPGSLPEVRAKGHGGRNRSIFQRSADAVSLRLSDLGTAVGLGAKERVRLLVTLEAEDAAALYRSIPPDVGLIVVGLPNR